MEVKNQQSEETLPAPTRPWSMGESWKALEKRDQSRLVGFLAFCAVLGIVFWKTLFGVVNLARSVDLHSHILLVPFVTAYLLWIRKENLPNRFVSSPVLAALSFAAASIPWVLASIWRLDGVDRLSAMTLSFVVFLIGGAYLFLGSRWVWSAAFPMFFLVFMIPLPNGAVDALEHASKLGSAEAADLLFALSGMSYVREGGVNFHLPGISLEVAQQCSGIRSSLVLFITGLFAANLLLRTPWRRALLAFVVIPLGLLRNGFRIVTLGYLAVHVDPKILDSAFHHRGGPIFFALSLVPLLAFVWWLRKGEARSGAPVKPSST